MLRIYVYSLIKNVYLIILINVVITMSSLGVPIGNSTLKDQQDGRNYFFYQTEDNYKTLIKTENSDRRVSLPSRPCNTNQDCKHYNLPMECLHGECECQDPYCWSYSYETNGFSSRYVFTCDTCGQIGSSCEKIPCDSPGECSKSDKYCHCPRGTGEPMDGICVSIEIGMIGQIILWTIGTLIFLLIGCTGIRLCCIPDQYGRRCQIFGLRQERRNQNTPTPIGVEKSPAYSMQHHINSTLEEEETRSDHEEETRITETEAPATQPENKIEGENIEMAQISSS